METQDSNNATTTQQTAQNTASTPTQTGAANPGSTEAKFTQADVDRMIADRLSRAEKREAKVKADLLAQLGLAEDTDFNTLKSTFEADRKRKEADMTESEKVKAELERERKLREVAEQKALTIEAERRNDKIASALTSAARGLNANEKALDDVVRHAQDKHSDAFNALIDDEGKVDQDKAKALVEKIKAEKEHYFSASKGTVQATFIPSNSGGRMVNGEAEAMKRASALNQRIIRGR